MDPDTSEKKGISGGEVAKRQTWREIMRINRKLLPMKFFLLLFYGGFSSLYPYLAIHIKSIGITVKQTGLIFTIYPICNCLGGPLAGIIGDKTGKYKLTLISMILLSIVLHLCILFAVPSYRITEPSFNRTFSSVEMHAECNATSILIRALPTAVIDSPPDVHDVSCSSTPSLLLHPFPLSSWNRTNCKVDCEDKSKCTTDHANCSRIFSLALDAVAKSADDLSIPFSWPCWPENASTSGWKGCTSVTCEITGSFTLPCRGRKTEGVQLVTFGVYTAIRLLIGMVISIGFTLMDASLIQMVEDFNGDVGINRAFILIGYCVMPPLSGLLIDHVSAGKQDIDYSPAFYIFAVCMALAAGILSLADLRLRKPAKNIFKNARQLLRFPRVVAFLCIYGVIGMGWGYLETFLFWFLADKDDLKAPNKFLGLTNAVGAVAGLPFAVAASWIISRTGHTTIFLVGVLVMGLRFVGYSLVTNYWLVLPLEARSYTNSENNPQIHVFWCDIPKLLDKAAQFFLIFRCELRHILFHQNPQILNRVEITRFRRMIVAL
ncbi:hypothetical protein BV898_16861 [Hypsibius exemplaris]|uniref:Major facilitator superfamily associated domain-containing protein n=1 Tax=Hypsibius exemplaris TaxID=2072580 RepID=A0A9X6NMN5_HYPEX|nr:hypothetical protein BV898_16861 [Hypsibius exemplaris]